MDSIIDLIDKKILTELDRNSRRSNNQIARKVGISRERAEYRIKQMVNRGIIRKFPTLINPTKFGYSMYKLYFQFQNIPLDIEKEIINWLIANPYVQWVTSCKGRWDMNIIIFAKDVEDFTSKMQEFYTYYSKYIYAQQFNITLAVGNMEKHWILGKKDVISKIIYTANERDDIIRDNIDVKLLNLIADNSRIPIITLAQKLRISAQTVKSKIRKLENAQIIKGYTVSIDYDILKKQFYKVIFYINVLTNDLKNKLIDYCAKRYDMPYFIFSAGEWPFEVEYVVDDLSEFYEALEDIKRHFPEIQRYESILLSKEHKFIFTPLEQINIK
ncbi:MAG: Lrp/AsnC family transcriptional regulator [Nanoarchaeota archaeon]